MRAQTLDGHDICAGQASSQTGLENRCGWSVSRARKAAVPFNFGATVLTKAFAGLTAATRTAVCRP